MMELTCAFVVILISVSTATPHGYGVKGGAAAKAEASAAAGAFGGIGAVPLVVPAGAGFAGSFSKTSSSSFASSSASSSASSFSYSGGGSSGLSGSNANSIAASKGGCTSGSCQGDTANALSASGANSIATPVGLGCTSGSCHGNGANGLASGLSASGTSITKTSDGCITGSCESNESNGITSGLSGVGAASIGTNGVVPGSSGNNPAGSGNTGCTSGSCINGGHKATNSADTGAHSDANAAAEAGNLSGNSDYNKNRDEISKCVGSNCDDVSYSGTKCTSGNCGPTSNTGLLSAGHGSNDIPVNIAGAQGTKTSYDAKEDSDKTSSYGSSGPACSFGNCGSSPSSYAQPTYTQGTPSIYSNTGSINHSQDFYNTQPLTPGTAPSPSYNKGVPATYLTTPKETTQGSKCTTPNCDSSIASLNPGTGNLPLSNGVQNTYPNTQPEGNNPICTSGNCGSNQPYTPNSNSLLINNLRPFHPGTEQNNNFGTPGTYNTQTSKAPTQHHTPAYQLPSGSGGSSCTTGSCAGYPATQITTGTGNAYPGSKIPSNSYGISPIGTSSGPIGSANCATPNCATFPSPHHNIHASKNPTPSQNGEPSFNSPTAGVTATNCETPNCAGFPSGTTAGAGSLAGSFGASKPSGSFSSTGQKVPAYTGGFGGPSGILKPLDYTVSSKPGYIHQQQPALSSTHPVGSITVSTSPDHTPSNIPTTNYEKPTVAGSINPVSCTSGSCNTQPGHTIPSYGQQAGATNQANAAAGATASANAISYSGGFGGPPGFLKPFDSGKASGVGHVDVGGKLSGSQYSGTHHNGASGSTHPTYSHNGIGSGIQGNTGAQAGAAAGATAGAFSGSDNQHGGHTNQGFGHNHGNQEASGCNSGCGSNGSGSLSGGANFGLSGGLGLSKTGLLDGLSSGLNAGGAVAKSVAGAVSGAGAGSFGLGGGFASSAATAHASSGAATKGGYGR